MYYTESGSIIRYPSSYAKTGAPMYKNKYSNNNINQPKSIYKILCEKGKIYIGSTKDIDRRMEEHFSGNGAKVTKKFTPLSGEELFTVNGYFAEYVENKITKQYIRKVGYSKVRGGKYVNYKNLK